MAQQRPQKATEVFPRGIVSAFYRGKADLSLGTQRSSPSWELEELHSQLSCAATHCYAALGELGWWHSVGHALHLEGHVGGQSVEVILSLQGHKAQKGLKASLVLKGSMRNKQRDKKPSHRALIC